MSHQLQITDGTTAINLSSSADNYLLYDWTPNNAIFNMTPQTIGDIGNRENVTEQIGIRVHDAVDKPAVQAKLQAITQLIAAAEHHYVYGNGPKVYLQFQVDGELDAWQSEVVGGALELGGGTLREWASVGANATLQIDRKFFWEMTSDQLLTIENSSSASGITVSITNNHDTNYVIIDDNQIEGDLPTPLKIRMRNTDSVMFGSHEFHISNNVFNDPDSFDGYLTAADLDSGTAAQSWTSSIHDSTSPRWAWDLSNGLLADCAGGWFRVIAGFSAMADNVYLKVFLYSRASGVNTLIWESEEEVYSGDQTLTALKLLDLGSIPLPPGGITSASGIRLGITARDVGDGNATVDFIELMPTTSYASPIKPNHAWSLNGAITDNGIDGTVYAGSDSARVPSLFKRYPPIYAWPGRKNRISILYRFGTTFPTGNTTDVTIWCRPRRTTL